MLAFNGAAKARVLPSARSDRANRAFEQHLAARQRRAEDADACVRQGGDPAGCRAAIYASNRDVNVQVGLR